VLEEYQEGPFQSYTGGASFIRRCEECGRFVRADDTIQVNEEVGLRDVPNATCSLHGRTKMIFLGFIEE